MPTKKVERLKLKAAVKTAWVKALRSGQYRQIQGQLQKDYSTLMIDGTPAIGYCCLGVLCVVVEKSNHNYGSSGIPSKNILQRAFSKYEFNADDKTLDVLIKMNDIKRKSFKHIAAWIEKNL